MRRQREPHVLLPQAWLSLVRLRSVPYTSSTGVKGQPWGHLVVVPLVVVHMNEACLLPDLTNLGLLSIQELLSLKFFVYLKSPRHEFLKTTRNEASPLCSGRAVESLYLTKAGQRQEPHLLHHRLPREESGTCFSVC